MARSRVRPLDETPRQSGRTNRMLIEAIRRRKKPGNHWLIAANDPHAQQLTDRLIDLAKGMGLDARYVCGQPRTVEVDRCRFYIVGLVHEAHGMPEGQAYVDHYARDAIVFEWLDRKGY